jgi:hypothetical protein
MAHLWMTGEDGAWTAHPLGAEGALAGDAAIRRTGTGSGDSWLLLAGDDVWLNGWPVYLGVAVLDDRDEIRTPAGRVFFSAEAAASIVAYPADAGRGDCPRCRQPLEPNTRAVRCPACGLFHHQTDDLPCWTYGDRCAGCPHPTSLDAGLRWTPEAC